MSMSIKSFNDSLIELAKRTGTDATDAPWTAARCQRLLRPLLVDIKSLKRDAFRECLGEYPTEAARKRPAPDEDPGPARANKKRKTYSFRSRRAQPSPLLGRWERKHGRGTGDSSFAGELWIHTPYLRKATGLPASSPIESQRRKSYFADKGGAAIAGVAAAAEITTLNSLSRTVQTALYDTFLHNYDNLLRATFPYRPKSSSLLAMCLRKVPACIAENEQMDLDEAEENGTKSALGSQASHDMYNQLEEIGAADGWRHLRELVRADAVSIICEAIRDKWFNAIISRSLIKLCISYTAYWDAEMIMSTLVDQQLNDLDLEMAGREDSADELPEPLLMMIDYAKVTGRVSSIFRKMATLLKHNQHAGQWVVQSDMQRLWTIALQRITDDSACPATHEFAVSLLSLLCTDSQSVLSPSQKTTASTTRPLGHTFISALSGLAACLILSQQSLRRHEHDEQANHSSQHSAAVSKNIINIIVATLAATQTARKADIKRKIYLLRLTLFLAAANSPESSTALRRIAKEAEVLLNDDTPTTTQPELRHDDIMALLSCIAHDCKRGDASSTHAHHELMQLCDNVDGLDLSPDAVLRIRVNSAFLLADRTKSLHDLQLAEKLWATHTNNDMANDQESPLRKPAYAGYHWDDTISEWVRASPPKGLKKQKSPTASRRRTRNSSGNGLPTPSPDSDDKNVRPTASNQHPLEVSSSGNVARSSARMEEIANRRASLRKRPAIQSLRKRPAIEDEDEDPKSPAPEQRWCKRRCTGDIRNASASDDEDEDVSETPVPKRRRSSQRLAEQPTSTRQPPQQLVFNDQPQSASDDEEMQDAPNGPASGDQDGGDAQNDQASDGEDEDGPETPVPKRRWSSQRFAEQPTSQRQPLQQLASNTQPQPASDDDEDDLQKSTRRVTRRKGKENMPLPTQQHSSKSSPDQDDDDEEDNVNTRTPKQRSFRQSTRSSRHVPASSDDELGF